MLFDYLFMLFLDFFFCRNLYLGGLWRHFVVGCYSMGGVEDEEPALKRTKLSPKGLVSVSNSSSSMEHVVGSTSGLMAPPLSAEGDDEDVGTKGILKRREFVRIITKAMYSLGYKKSGEHLEEESGIPLKSSAVNLFMQQVLDGDWDESLATLKQIGIEDESIVKAASLLILEQKFFELIDGDKVIEALNTLRNQITQLCVDSTRIRELSSCFMSPSGQGGSSGLDFVRAKTRLKLLEELQKLFPSTVMIPEKRLEHLVEQALTMERVASLCRTALDKKMSLCSDVFGQTQILTNQAYTSGVSDDNESINLSRADFGRFVSTAERVDKLEEKYKMLLSMLSELISLFRTPPPQ